MATKSELMAEVAKLKKLLKERDELLMQAAIKAEHLDGARIALESTTEEIKRKRRSTK